VETTPVIFDGVVYAGSSVHLYALKAADGSFLHKYRTGADVESTPVITDGILYVGSNDKCVYAIKIR
jgi:eukaryotic-like serine/threonine-protein kinase